MTDMIKLVKNLFFPSKLSSFDIKDLLVAYELVLISPGATEDNRVLMRSEITADLLRRSKKELASALLEFVVDK
jgi:hypothetical protein